MIDDVCENPDEDDEAAEVVASSDEVLCEVIGSDEVVELMTVGNVVAKMSIGDDVVAEEDELDSMAGKEVLIADASDEAASSEAWPELANCSDADELERAAESFNERGMWSKGPAEAHQAQVMRARVSRRVSIIDVYASRGIC